MSTTSQDAERFSLPARYFTEWREPFYSRARAALVPGATVLDVGSGARPAIPEALRPPRCHYVGLDVSAVELDRAGALAYDETRVANVVQKVEGFQGRFDLIVSWQVLEHVKPLSIALENLRTYLRPGGLFVGQLSGSFAAYALVTRLVPHPVGQWASSRLLGRDPETMFRTYYDQCHYRALLRLLAPWREVEVVPRYAGAGYFNFSSRIRSVYLAYENWACRRDHRSLATHYLVAARR